MSGYIVRLFILLACGGAVWWAITYARNSSRHPAAAAEKDQYLKPTHGGIIHTEKVRGPIKTSLRLIGSPAGQVGSAFTMEAIIEVNRDVLGARFRWSLPAGLKLVSGRSNGTVPDLRAGEQFRTTIVVEQAEAGNHQIHFAVDGSNHGVRYASVSQYNSVFEEFLQAEREVVRNQAIEHSLRNSSRLMR